MSWARNTILSTKMDLKLILFNQETDSRQLWIHLSCPSLLIRRHRNNLQLRLKLSAWLTQSLFIQVIFNWFRLKTSWKWSKLLCLSRCTTSRKSRLIWEMGSRWILISWHLSIGGSYYKMTLLISVTSTLMRLKKGFRKTSKLKWRNLRSKDWWLNEYLK